MLTAKQEMTNLCRNLAVGYTQLHPEMPIDTALMLAEKDFRTFLELETTALKDSIFCPERSVPNYTDAGICYDELADIPSADESEVSDYDFGFGE